LLPDGRVLVVGGNGAGVMPLTAAEIYDPIADQWRFTDAMAALRAYHSATLLPDGRVLVVGGFDPVDDDFTVFASAEIFDPATNGWVAAATLAASRQRHRALLLPSGAVLVVGGIGRGDDQLLTSAELYDGAHDRWRTIPLRDGGRIHHTTTLLLDGNVLIIGGWRPSMALDSVVRYTSSPGLLRQPQLEAATLDAQDQITMYGAGLRPPLSGSSDGARQSATNAPLVQLRHLDSEWQFWPGQASGTLFSAVTVTTTALISTSALLSGPVIATIFVNGAPSNSRFVNAAQEPQPLDATLFLPLISKE
jgi:hypothetical protein